MEWNILEQFKLVPDESIFLDLTPEEVALIFTLWGLVAAQSLTIDELNVLANGLFETAQIMFVIASQRTLINDAIQAQQDKKETEKAKEEQNLTEKLESEIKKLQDQIKHLQKQIDELKT
jgi:predicted ribosome quality control (RQC) complex YloA/Tae2 family protein